ncbi:MAG: hypothetical protein KA807_07060 [Prolixibacteraceae bacterium]|nr:hypothetical protein [Prolixibacteraceae bacterium]
MRFLSVLVIFILFSINTYSQCYEYASEIQNAESSLSDALKYLKKVEKTITIEEAQDLTDNAIESIDEASRQCNMAESYASDCNCENGIQVSKNIYLISSDLLKLLKKATASEEITVVKQNIKKITEIADNAKSEISYGINACGE